MQDLRRPDRRRAACRWRTGALDRLGDFGPSGAGKTRPFSTCSPGYKPTSGRTCSRTRIISRTRPDRITRISESPGHSECPPVRRDDGHRERADRACAAGCAPVSRPPSQTAPGSVRRGAQGRGERRASCWSAFGFRPLDGPLGPGSPTVTSAGSRSAAGARLRTKALLLDEPDGGQCSTRRSPRTSSSCLFQMRDELR